MSSHVFSSDEPKEASPRVTNGRRSITSKQVWAVRDHELVAGTVLIGGRRNETRQAACCVGRTLRLGYPESAIVGIGLALIASTLLYLVPRTSTLGAVLLTGYLGGAVATHVRVGADWMSILFPVFFATLIWGGLWLRDRRLQDLLPLRAL